MESEREEVAGLWAPPGLAVASQLVAAVAVAAVTLTVFGGEDPTAWELLSTLAGGLVSGLCLGVGVCLHRQGRMVRHHMAFQHPGVPVPESPRA